MRDPARINRIINKLRDYWNSNPDLRLGQILINLTPDRFSHKKEIVEGGLHYHVYHTDPYHVEDNEWEQVIDQALKPKDSK